MNFKLNLTKTLLAFCVSALLMLQPAIGQIAKTKKVMTREQIEAFLKKAREKGWQLTVKTKNGSNYSGKLELSSDSAAIRLFDQSFIFGLGPCGFVTDSGYVNTIKLDEIISVANRNIPLHILRSTGEISYSVASTAIGGALMLPALPVLAIKDAVEKAKK